MSEREKLQLAVRRWRLRDHPWQVRFERFALLEAALAAADGVLELRRIADCTSYHQARAERAQIMSNELDRIARASACAAERNPQARQPHHTTGPKPAPRER